MAAPRNAILEVQSFDEGTGDYTAWVIWTSTPAPIYTIISDNKVGDVWLPGHTFGADISFSDPNWEVTAKDDNAPKTAVIVRRLNLVNRFDTPLQRLEFFVDVAMYVDGQLLPPNVEGGSEMFQVIEAAWRTSGEVLTRPSLVFVVRQNDLPPDEVASYNRREIGFAFLNARSEDFTSDFSMIIGQIQEMIGQVTKGAVGKSLVFYNPS